MLDNCTASCGWVGAIISCVSMGSFAVPIKTESVKSVDVDPLVFHTYKVLLCFLTSFVVLPLGQDFYFTPWGIISNIFWVPASISSVYAVKHAGLAVSQGVSCTCIVLISFVWGIFIFDEEVKSKTTASLAILLIVMGLWGMSIYSSPEAQDHSHSHTPHTGKDEHYHSLNEKRDIIIIGKNMKASTASLSSTTSGGSTNTNTSTVTSPSNGSFVYTDNSSTSPLLQSGNDTGNDGESFDVIMSYGTNTCTSSTSKCTCATIENQNTNMKSSSSYLTIADDEDLELIAGGTITGTNNNDVSSRGDDSENMSWDNMNTHTHMPLTGTGGGWSPRTLGLLASVFNGLWGGSIFVPMHYAPPQANGTGYAISFAIGAVIVTTFAWIVLFVYYLIQTADNDDNSRSRSTRTRSRKGSGMPGTCMSMSSLRPRVHIHIRIHDAYDALPCFHLQTLWFQGSVFGILWNLGNIASMVSVQTLGEGIGYSVTQANMLVGGMWGIFYFQEVTQFDTKLKWFSAALITITGILLLSNEHE